MLYQRVWSGLTKILIRAVQEQSKAIEIPGFGIVAPVIKKWETLRNPLDKCVTQDKSNFSLNRPLVVFLSPSFAEKSGI
jgi:hypothetical protein